MFTTIDQCAKMFTSMQNDKLCAWAHSRFGPGGWPRSKNVSQEGGGGKTNKLKLIHIK